MTGAPTRSLTMPARYPTSSQLGTQPPHALAGPDALAEWAANCRDALKALDEPWMGALASAWLVFSRAQGEALETLAACLSELPTQHPEALPPRLELGCQRLLERAPQGELLAQAVSLVHAFQAAVLRCWVHAAHEEAGRRTHELRSSHRAMLHDLSNIMSALSGNLDYMDQMAAGSGMPKDPALVDATSAARLAHDVVGRAADLLSLESGIQLSARWVGLEPLLKSLRLPQGFRVEASSLPRQILCAEPSMARVLRFLCNRALAVCSQPAPVMRVEHASQMLRITVVDQGPTLNAAAAASLLAGTALEPRPGFPNERVDRTRGFHICSMVVRAHGGELGLQSPAAGGMRAEIVLPQPRPTV